MEAQEAIQRFGDLVSQSDLALLPIHSQGPPAHWALLVVEKAEGEAPAAARFYDSLTGGSAASLAQAAAALDLLQSLGHSVQHSLPATASCRRQTDGWSCGHWVLLHAEEEYRQSRGEGKTTLFADFDRQIVRINKFFSQVLKVKVSPKGTGKSSGKGSGKSSGKPPPPPLPPPSQPPVPEEEAPASQAVQADTLAPPSPPHSQLPVPEEDAPASQAMEEATLPPPLLPPSQAPVLEEQAPASQAVEQATLAPPLPPPSQAPGAEEETQASQPVEAATLPPPSQAPEQSMPPPPVPARRQINGCSKCRGSASGCRQCNPDFVPRQPRRPAAFWHVWFVCALVVSVCVWCVVCVRYVVCVCVRV